MLNKTVTLIFIIIGLIFILLVGPSHDEAYYYTTYSKFLDWGFYDHPPMVGVLIKFGEALFPNPFALRIFFFMMGLLNIVILSKITKKSFWDSNSILLNFILFYGASTLAIPDGPLLFFTFVFFYGIKKYIDEDSKSSQMILVLSIIGMLYSKYHGGLTIIFTLMAMPQLLKRKSLWLIALVSILGFLPHLLWQYQHDFVTFKFHLFGRAGSGFSLKNIFEFIVGQFLILGGLNLLGLFKQRHQINQNSWTKFLMKNILFNFIFLIILSFRNKMEANWTTSLIPPLAILIAEHKEYFIKKYQTNLLLVAIPALFIKVVVSFDFIDLNSTRLSEFHNWKYLSYKIKNECQNQIIFTNNYQEASQLSYYLQQDIRAIHKNGRMSQFSLLENQSLVDNFCFVSRKAYNNSVSMGLDYKHEIFVTKDFSL